MAQNIAKSRGFSDVLYLDSESKKNLEEVSSCNIFIAKVLLICRKLSAIFACDGKPELDFDFVGKKDFNTCYQRNHTSRNHEKKCD